MARVGRGLELIRDSTRDGEHLEIVGTVEHIARKGEQCGWRSMETVAFEESKGRFQTRILYRDIGSIFV